MPSLTSSPGHDRGAVTAETAVVLPVLILVTWLVLAMLRLGDAQLSCQDAARAAARAASRGEPLSVVVETARRAAPDDAGVTVEEAAGLVTVEVTARVSWFGPWGGKTFAVAGRAVAASEGAAP